MNNPAVSGLAKALVGEVASLLKLELARLSVADVQPVLLDVKQAAVYFGALGTVCSTSHLRKGSARRKKRAEGSPASE